MRVVLALWGAPLVLFWGWYGLSAYNINFGLFFLERRFHDAVFGIYSNILGIPAEEIPLLVAKLLVIDTLIILAVAALRWYKKWLPQSIAWIKSQFSEQEKVGKLELNDRVQKLARINRSIGSDHLIGPVQPAE
ncbi:MAG: DUF6105 family protein [Pseudomonadota bacterium]